MTHLQIFYCLHIVKGEREGKYKIDILLYSVVNVTEEHFRFRHLN